MQREILLWLKNRYMMGDRGWYSATHIWKGLRDGGLDCSRQFVVVGLRKLRKWRFVLVLEVNNIVLFRYRDIKDDFPT